MPRSEIQNIFSERMTKIRAELGLTGPQAAEIIGISSPTGRANTLYNLENKHRDISLDVAFRVSTAYNTPIDYLVGKSDDKHSIGREPQYINTNKEVFAFNRTTIKLDNYPQSCVYTHEYVAKRALVTHKLISMLATDDSMKGVINEYDELLIDQNKTTVTKRDIFAILVNNDIWIRWIQPEISGNYTISCEDERSYPSLDLPAEEFKDLKILGRVVRISRDR